jgi:hypothetical protein
MNFIINPLNGEKYSIYTEQGKSLLKSYVQFYKKNNQVGGVEEEEKMKPQEKHKKTEYPFVFKKCKRNIHVGPMGTLWPQDKKTCEERTPDEGGKCDTTILSNTNACSTESVWIYPSTNPELYKAAKDMGLEEQRYNMPLPEGWEWVEIETDQDKFEIRKKDNQVGGGGRVHIKKKGRREQKSGKKGKKRGK